MNTERVLRICAVFLTGALLSLASCRPSQPASPTLTTFEPVAPTASPTASPLPSATPTATPIPAMTATAEAFQAAAQATVAALDLPAIQDRLESLASCQDISPDQPLLTSPVLPPAEIGQMHDGVVFRAPAGTVVRAPMEGDIQLGTSIGLADGQWLECANLSTGTTQVITWVLVCFPRGGYEYLVEEPYAEVRRGDPIARLNGSTFRARPWEIAGLDSYNVFMRVNTIVNGEFEFIPLGVSGDLWYQGFPTACRDWPAEPTPVPVSQATSTPAPALATPEIPTPPPYMATIPTPMGRIAFIGESDDDREDVFVADLTDGTVQQITHGEWDISTLVGWPLDNTRHLLLLVEGPQRMVLLDLATGEGTTVLGFPTGEQVWSSHLSPDSSRLAWRGRVGDSLRDLYVADLASGQSQLIFQAEGGIGSPAWSPDSQQVAAVISGEIHLISAEGDDAQQITDFSAEPPASSPFRLGGLVWSPDGTRIAFGVYSEADSSLRVCTLALAGHTVACFDGEDQPEAWPRVWLPDNQRLIVEGGGEVYLLNVQSGEVFNLTNDPAVDVTAGCHAIISPGGQFLVFVSERDHWRGEVYILHIASGTLVARVTADFVGQRGAVWSQQ